MLRLRSSGCVCVALCSRAQCQKCISPPWAHIRPQQKKITQALRWGGSRCATGVYGVDTNPVAMGTQLMPPGKVCTRACTPPRAHLHAVHDAPHPRVTQCKLQGGRQWGSGRFRMCVHAWWMVAAPGFVHVARTRTMMLVLGTHSMCPHNARSRDGGMASEEGTMTAPRPH